MKRNWQRLGICAGIVAASTTITLLLENVRFFQLLDLKARDAHFVLRGKQPTRDIVLIGIDQKALDSFPELTAFWHPYYATAIRGAADAGAKVLVLDVAFGIPVTKYEPENDTALAEAYTYAAPKMPVISAFVASTSDQTNPAFAVPINMMASAFGTAAMANLTADSDDFVRKQVMIESPKPGEPASSLIRSMSLRAAEKFLGKEATFRNGRLYLGDRLIPTDDERNIIINYAGPADTFPRISLYDFVQAVRSGKRAQLEQWVKGKVVLLGPDNRDDRHATPFYTAFTLTDKWRTSGVEIHANSLRTLLTGEFIRPVPYWAGVIMIAIAAGATVAAITPFAVAQTTALAFGVLAVGLVIIHLFFRMGWLLSTTDLLLVFLWSLVGGVIYRFATAEKKSSFFKNAVALFVGKQVARSLDLTEQLGLTGKAQKVTILFSDIRGFTAFCESKDPAVVVKLLNAYMAVMCAIIVKHGGHVNKFIGDGILAVFSDEDDGAKPGDHALRAVRCAIEMVTAPGDFKTGTGLHSGEVVIGNVGSNEKMEFTVLGDTVNLASRLESLNKEHKTRLLLSEATSEMLGGQIDTFCLGTVAVRGKSVPMKLYTVRSLAPEEALKRGEPGKQKEVPAETPEVAGAAR
jgi:adenylate cyclase